MQLKFMLSVIGTGILLFSSVVPAQQPDEPKRPQAGQSGQMMQRSEMMKQCRMHCQRTSDSIDQTMKMMQEARASNDPEKMRCALEEAQKPLADMKNHMNRCMRMMDMMQNMRGGTDGTEEKTPEEKRK